VQAPRSDGSRARAPEPASSNKRTRAPGTGNLRFRCAPPQKRLRVDERFRNARALRATQKCLNSRAACDRRSGRASNHLVGSLRRRTTRHPRARTASEPTMPAERSPRQLREKLRAMSQNKQKRATPGDLWSLGSSGTRHLDHKRQNLGRAYPEGRPTVQRQLGTMLQHALPRGRAAMSTEAARSAPRERRAVASKGRAAHAMGEGDRP
jgi:hypothetical protein